MLRLGVDIGGTKIAVGLFNENGKIVHEKYLVKNVVDLPDFIADAASSLAELSGCSVKDIVSVGIGVPGTVSNDARHVLKAPNISIIRDDLCERTEDLLGATVHLVQDSRAAAYGEYLFGGARNTSVAVCVTVGTGIGTGIVIDGKIFNGGLGCAGETGHIPVAASSRVCGCGRRGCLETLSAGKGLDMTARKLLGEGCDAHDLFSAARNGDLSAISAIAEARIELGRALTSIVNILSPDVLLISGGISQQRELYLDPVIAYVREHCYKASSEPRIEIAQLGELSPLYGAAFI